MNYNHPLLKQIKIIKDNYNLSLGINSGKLLTNAFAL
jgi:hypothetical protein